VVTIIEDELPSAGFDPPPVNGCEGEFVSDLFGWLGATADPGGTWFDLDNSGSISSDGIFSFDGVPAGQYDFEYVVSNIGCGSDSGLVTVNVMQPIEIANLTFDCDMEEFTYTASFDILFGDSSDYAVTGGSGALIPGPTFSYVTDANLLYDPLILTVSGGFCGDAQIDTISSCDFGSLVFVPESFSPNGDLINDFFEIQGIEGFPNNVIQVYNRWGNIIYEAQGYDNESVRWDGSSVDGLLGDQAPAGTYYYVLDLDFEGAEVIRGFVYLNR